MVILSNLKIYNIEKIKSKNLIFPIENEQLFVYNKYRTNVRTKRIKFLDKIVIKQFIHKYI